MVMAMNSRDFVRRGTMRYLRVTLTGTRRAVLVALLLVAPAVSWAITRGPDPGGYTATDATVYSFVDISGASGGTSILADTDDGAAALTLPFTFQFYGHGYTLVCVSSNGALYFTTSAGFCSGIVDFANTDLTTTSPPGDTPALLPFWTDLSFQVAGAGAVFYQAFGVLGSRRFVVQWNNAYPDGSPNPVTFQAILFEGSNNVLFQYKTVALGLGNPANNGAQATVGIRNAGALDSTDALGNPVLGNHQQIEWSSGAPVLSDNTALLFSGSSDTTAPVTTSILSGPLGSNGWYTGSVQVSLSASDPDSPVAGTSYQVDGGSTLTYSAPFTVFGDGVHHLSYSSTDPAGNHESPKTSDIKIDETPPSVTARARPPVLWPANGKTKLVTVSGMVRDAVSGVDRNSARFVVTDEYGKVQPTGGISLASNGRYSFNVSLVASRDRRDRDGRKYTITCSAKDIAGNLRSVSAVVTVPHDMGEHKDRDDDRGEGKDDDREEKDEKEKKDK